jgi:hypothetical protein
MQNSEGTLGRWRRRTACSKTASSEDRFLALPFARETDAAFQRTADRLFAQGETGWFVPTLRKLTRRLVDVALAVRPSNLSSPRTASEPLCPAGRTSKGGPEADTGGRSGTDAGPTNGHRSKRPVRQHVPHLPAGSAHSAPHRTSESPCKRDALFFLANTTFRVYFALSNLRLCDTVLNNTQNSTAQLDTFPKADRCAFLYYRGRISLYQRRLPQARNDLRRAFALCRADSWKNGRCALQSLYLSWSPC